MKLIIDDAKEVLLKFKDEGVSESGIFKLCDETISLLTASKAYFSALFKDFPKEEDIVDATNKRDQYLKLIRAREGMNVTMKTHLIEKHSIKCMRNCARAGVPLRLIVK